MMKLDDEKNYDFDHITMISLLFVNNIILVNKNQSMNHEHVISLINAMLFI